MFLRSVLCIFPAYLYVVCSLRRYSFTEDVLVKIKYGVLQGSRRRETFGIPDEVETIDEFMNIPYAKPPVGKRRFRPPEAAESWSHVRLANRPGKVCPQPLVIHLRLEDQSEDCLTLNIHAPYEPDAPNRRYAVMVFIHGGSYLIGSGAIHSGGILAKSGVVVVSINYRLGVLGFITTSTSELPGNYGLLDQIQALKWVQENIANFRGDPSRVTIFGNSAGAASVGLLVLSPLAKGLFHHAVCQSGSPSSFWAIHNRTADLRAHVRRVADILDCRQTDLKDMVECLRDIDWQMVVGNYDRYPRITPSGTDFKPWMDGFVLPDYPEDIVKRNLHNNVTLMTGTVKDEWARNLGWFINELMENHLLPDDDFDDGISRDTFVMAIRHVVKRRFGWKDAIADIIINEYTNWKKPDEHITNRNEYVQFFTDVSMIAPTVLFSHLMAQRNMSVYQFTFNHSPRNSFPKWYGSYHSIELNFVFGSPFRGIDIIGTAKHNYTQQDRTISIMVMKMWSNFAKYGNPTPEPLLNNETWHKFTPENADYLHINSSRNTHMRTHLRRKAVHFWNDVMPEIVDALNGGFNVCQHMSRGIELWMFATVTIVLLLVVLTLLIVLIKGRHNNQYSLTSSNGTAVVIADVENTR